MPWWGRAWQGLWGKQGACPLAPPHPRVTAVGGLRTVAGPGVSLTATMHTPAPTHLWPSQQGWKPAPALRGLSAPWPRRPPFPLQPQSECFGSRNQSRLMESFPTPTSHLSHSPQPGVGCGEGPPHCVAPPFCASQKGEAVTRDAATSQADGAQEGCGDWGPLAGRTSPQPSLDTSSRAHGPLLPLAIACEPCLGAVVLPGGQERGLRLPGSELEEMALVASLAPRCYTLPTPAPCLSHPALFPAVLWAGLWPYYKPCCISVVSTCPVPHPNALWTRPASSPGWAQRASACP